MFVAVRESEINSPTGQGSSDPTTTNIKAGGNNLSETEREGDSSRIGGGGGTQPIFGECLNSVHDITLDSDSNVGEELGDSDGMIANVGRQELASTEAAATDNAVADDVCNGTQ